MNATSTQYLMRHITPPTGLDASLPSSASSKKSSSSKSSYTYDHSPRSVASSQTTTPPRTPNRSLGPTLLPSVRKQDQDLGHIAMPQQHHHHHARSVSMTSTGFPIDYSQHLSRPSLSCRSVSPSDYMHTPVSATSLLTPASATGLLTPSSAATNPDTCVDPFRTTYPAPYPYPMAAPMAHSRSTSTASGRAPSRSSPGPSPDDIARYAYPTYRQIPTCAAASAPSANYATTVPLEAVAAYYQQQQQQRTNAPPPLPAELCFESYADQPKSTTLLNYLTEPNPTPGLVRRVPTPSRTHDRHFWWDIRNLRNWSDFCLKTILKVPGFTELLNQDLPEPALPSPEKLASQPETLADLQDSHASWYVSKVNAALRVALGAHNTMTLRAVKPSTAPGARAQPDFLAAYSSDYERTVFGDERGRVIGLVKNYETWNTGKRAGGPTAQIEFLRELAHLHHLMREHSCRYGFILTEIELLCVRAGTESVPNFGFLELAPPVALKVHRGEKEELTLTACLALWHLCMLAKNAPLPGQLPWKLDVGGPAACTRKKHLARDQWMFKPEGREKRDAKRNRGWVFPEEPLSRRECAKGKRAK